MLYNGHPHYCEHLNKIKQPFSMLWLYFVRYSSNEIWSTTSEKSNICCKIVHPTFCAIRAAQTKALTNVRLLRSHLRHSRCFLQRLDFSEVIYFIIWVHDRIGAWHFFHSKFMLNEEVILSISMLWLYFATYSISLFSQFI